MRDKELLPEIIPIQGTVADNTGKSLDGVSVVVRGTNKGTSTDTDGRFTIDANPGDVLVFSRVGYKSVSRTVGTSTSIRVTMEIEEKEGDEVVVIGYGTLKRSESTGAITSLKKDDFVKGIVKSPEQLLQGKVPGLQIVNNTGDPVIGLQMNIRGVNSLSGNTSPLIVIDGFPGGSLTAISPEDVESVDVLKDGAAAAIYGTRGTNGVIIITTKKRQGSKQQLDFNSILSVENINKTPNMLTAEDYQNYKALPEFTGMIDEGENSNWVDAITRKAFGQSYYISLSGGAKHSNYISSLEYKNREGIINKTDRESITGRFTINQDMYEDRVQFQLSLNNTYVVQSRVWYNTFLHALLENPTRPIYDDMGNYTEYRINLKPFNPVALINEESDKEGFNQLMASAKLRLNPLQGLSLSIMGGMQRFDRLENKSNTFQHISTTLNGDFGNVWNWADNSLEKIFEIVSSYNKTFKMHQVSLLAGYSYIDDDSKGISQWAKDFPTDMFGAWNIGSLNNLKQDKASINSYRNTHRLVSFFGRINYNISDKYSFMSSLRKEGSSRFGTANKWGVFPAVSIGWRLGKENFIKNIEPINDLKLRFGYGETGNEVSQNYLSLYLLNYGGYSFLNGQWVQGIAPFQNPNPNLKWETKKELNVGIDFELFDRRLSGSFDIYKRKTIDLLASYVVPTPPNLIPSMVANVGDIENKGIEVLLNSIILQKQDLKLNVITTFSFNKNKILSLSNEQYERNYWYEGATGSPIQTYTHIVKEGAPVGNFYGYKTYGLTEGGLWLVYANDNSSKLLSAASDADKRVLGNGLPSTYGSMTFSFLYKKIDCSVMFRGAFDYQILNTQRMHWETTKRIGEGNLPRSVLNKPFNSNSFVQDIPAMQSYYIEDGDFVKLANASLGYSIDIKKQEYFKKMRLFVSAENLLTFTGYKGIDPEVGIKGLAPGVDGVGTGTTYPTTRLYCLGINFTL